MSAPSGLEDTRRTSPLDWAEVTALACHLSALVMASGFSPDMLVAIARGGWIPTRLLSRELGVKKLASIGIVYADPARIVPTIYSAPDVPRDCRALLVVEDRVETGRALIVAAHHLRSCGADLTVKSACFFHQTSSLIVPDFSLGARDSIIRFPWE